MVVYFAGYCEIKFKNKKQNQIPIIQQLFEKVAIVIYKKVIELKMHCIAMTHVYLCACVSTTGGLIAKPHSLVFVALCV